MARRSKKTLIDDIYEILKGLPAWCGPMLALFAFVGFRWILPALFANAATDKRFDLSPAIRTLTPTLSL